MNSMKLLGFSILFVFVSCGTRMKSVSETNEYGYKTEYSLNPKTQMKEGVYKVYDKEGKLYEEATYSKDEINGNRTLFYPNGQKEIVETLVNGKYHGAFNSYYENGKLKAEGNYEDNIAIGQWKSYYESGQLKDIATFSNNEENGPFKEYHENGNLKTEGTYKDGDQEHGELLLYDEEGQLEKKMDCNLGHCKTTWKKTEQKS